MKQGLKEALTRAGAPLPLKAIRTLDAAVNYLEVGRWMKARGYDATNRFKRREDLFEAITQALGDRPVLYLEFGVYRGDSLRRWSELLRHPDARLHGFDSFEGLPETWSYEEHRGHFSTEGALPSFDDPRIELFKGWFEETLPGYELPPHGGLVIVIDSDLYSSASFVFESLADRIVPGTFLYFDEFHHRAHELRAFSDFLHRTGFEFRLFGATRELTHVAFLRDC
jgi:hypothetical protein